MFSVVLDFQNKPIIFSSSFFQDIAVNGVDLQRMEVVVISSPKNAPSECFSPFTCRHMPFRFRELKCQWKQ